MAAILLAATLVAYNNAINSWPPFHGWAYLPANVLATTLAVIAARTALGLSASEIGFGTSGAGGAALVVSMVTVLLAVACIRRSTARFLLDERMAGTSNAQLAYVALLRIPLGTALFEEVAFRGVLFAAWRSHGDLEAALFSSLAFGLWHISPTLNLVRANRPGTGGAKTLGVVAGAVLFTTAAGLLFVWMRLEGGSLAAPFVVHAGVNSSSAIASVAARRRLNQQPDSSGRSGLNTS